MDWNAFRSNVQAMFQRELGITMVPGVLDGKNDTFGEWIGSVAIQKVTEDPRNVNEVTVSLVCRFFAPFNMDATVSPNQPYDPSPLEAMAAQIQQAVEKNQTGLGAWFQRVTDIEFDLVDQGVQAMVFARAWNDATNAA